MATTQRSKWTARVERDTRFLRTDDSPLYRRIRTLLRRKGIDVEQVVAAVVGPEDQDCEFGIVVTPQKQVYEYESGYPPDACAGGGVLRLARPDRYLPNTGTPGGGHGRTGDG